MNEYIKSSSTHILDTMNSPTRMLRYSKVRVKNLYSLYVCVCIAQCVVSISKSLKDLKCILVNVVIHSHILVHACTYVCMLQIYNSLLEQVSHQSILLRSHSREHV